MDQGADIETTDKEGRSALLLAAKEGKAETLELLIEVRIFTILNLKCNSQRGGNIEFAGDRGITPLFAACQTGREKCVESN